MSSAENSKRCKHCGAPIDWVFAPNGKKIPVSKGLVSLTPDKNGVVTGVQIDGTLIKGNLAMNGAPGSVKVLISHLSVCQAAKKEAAIR